MTDFAALPSIQQIAAALLKTAIPTTRNSPVSPSRDDRFGKTHSGTDFGKAPWWSARRSSSGPAVPMAFPTGKAAGLPPLLCDDIPSSMRTRIKVCCIASPEEASMAIEAGADALGLVARMPSGPGPISDTAIAEVTAFAPPPIATFLLTSETTAEAISAHVRATNPSTVQVVSHIDPAESEKLAVWSRTCVGFKSSMSKDRKPSI